MSMAGGGAAGGGHPGSAHPRRWELSRLQRVGLTSWAVLGVILLTVVGARAIGAVSGIVVPLLVAAILGTVLEPLVEILERVGLRQRLAAVAALLVAVGVLVGTVVIVARGFVQQMPEISRQLTSGWRSFVRWAGELDIEAQWLERARTAVESYAPKLGQGLLGTASSTLTGAISFAVGTFFALFFLFFVLRDMRSFPGWVARVTSLDTGLVGEVAEATQQSLRGYFKGIALTAIITAPIFMVPLLLLKVPLAIPIFILYFFTSFIPFVGAWIAGIFAVLIAFGSGGATAALIMAVAILVSNGMIQSAVSSWALGSSLDIHPVTVLLATIVGGTIAGLIGMILGAPLLAATVKAVSIIRRRTGAIAQERGGGADPGPPAASPP